VVLALAPSQRPKLTLYVRSRSKLSSETLSSPSVRVVEGTLRDESALKDAMTGIDTVLSFLGAPLSLSALVLRIKTTPIADSLPTVFAAMRSQNVTRILALSTSAFQQTVGGRPESLPWKFWLTRLFPPLLVPQGHAEMKAIAINILTQSDFDWTIYRIPYLNNGSADLPVAAGLFGPDYKGSMSLSRASLARWLLQVIDKGEWIRGAPAVANY
jgi:hypothetical protein